MHFGLWIFDFGLKGGSRHAPAMSGAHPAIQNHKSKIQNRKRRGTVLVVTLWGIIVLTAILLLMAQSMQVEVLSSGNRLGAVQCASLMHGAEQYVLSLVESAGGDPTVIIDSPQSFYQVGDGYFFLIKPDPYNEENTAFGLTDEAAKANLNVLQEAQILKLPGMGSQNQAADSLLDWIDADSNVTNQGAETDFYTSQGYQAKNDKLESIDELRLVQGFRMLDVRNNRYDLLYGYDRNQDGILDPAERNGPEASLNSANGAGRGIAPFVTVYSIEANKTGANAANVNDDNTQNVRNALAKVLPQGRGDQIVDQARRVRPFTSVFDFAAKGGMTPDELKAAYSSLTYTTAKTIIGRINVNTAPREVLLCLPGLEEGDVDSLISKRTTGDTSGLGWVYEALGPQKAGPVGTWITDKSYQYSADIVAITGNGHNYKRVRIVVDGRSSPAKIIYRKDVSDLGFPQALQDFRQQLLNGERPVPGFGSGGVSGF
jgi:type II secretory pathway component PulK